ncbi:MAG: hypothetical protein KDB52_05745 [Solirubrobacterales bacterium]|nr:hypothetical protein [Solirubrobacterales bacterium]
MSRVHHIELQCEIDPQRESIHGEMSDRQGKKLPFAGWTEFSTALMELARGDADKNKPTEEDKRGS